MLHVCRARPPLSIRCVCACARASAHFYLETVSGCLSWAKRVVVWTKPLLVGGEQRCGLARSFTIKFSNVKLCTVISRQSGNLKPSPLSVIAKYIHVCWENHSTLCWTIETKKGLKQKTNMWKGKGVRWTVFCIFLYNTFRSHRHLS